MSLLFFTYYYLLIIPAAITDQANAAFAWNLAPTSSTSTLQGHNRFVYGHGMQARSNDGEDHLEQANERVSQASSEHNHLQSSMKYFKNANTIFARNINVESTLSRRQALSKGLAATTGIASSSIFNSSINPNVAYAVSPTNSSPTTPTITSTSPPLLSSYDPTKYTSNPLSSRSLVPPSFLPPLTHRATHLYPLSRDTYALEQLLAFANVTATIRTNIVRLSHGGLWVCGPLWPTEEYCQLLNELGEVTDVVLPVNALEHKAAMRQFVGRYPGASVWVAPGQYGPFGSCGVVTGGMTAEEVEGVVRFAKRTMGHRVDGVLPVGSYSQQLKEEKPNNMLPSWIDEFDIDTLYVELPENAGPVSECAFLHKRSNTLFVTDAVICVPSVSSDPNFQSTHMPSAKSDYPTFPIQPIFETFFDKATISDPTFWPRTVLQAVFLPLRSVVTEEGEIKYPGYEALTNRLVRAPILRAFADARAPEAVKDWVDRIVGSASTSKKSETKGFDRIVTAHFASPIAAGPELFAAAFSHLLPLEGKSNVERYREELDLNLPPIACRDWSTLDSLNDFIGENKLGAPVVYDYKIGCKD